MFARVLRTVSVTLVALLGLFGGVFISGEIFNDPGGAKAAILVAAWAIPLAGLALLAILRPTLAGKVLPAALGVVGAFALIDASGGLIDHDAWGPVGVIAIFAVAVPCGLLGIHRAWTAGWLLLAGAAVLATARFIQVGGEGGPGGGALFGGSSGALVVPLLTLGFLFLSAALSEQPERGHRHHPTSRLGPAH